MRKEANKKKTISTGIGVIVEQPITQTLEKNYMPYAMSVIVSRAIPEIDGFKPSHRKILYTMYKMGLLGTARTKSANVVGQTMRLNPHGDAAIYETLVRLSRGYEALILPYIDSKGNFGKSYSRDMAYAASRYTEVKLDAICGEFFKDIDKDTIDFVDNYDSSTKEPTLLPTSFPSVLVNLNLGIAVGMASSICSFNLAEVCDTTIALIKNPNHDVSSTLKAPDFAGGGAILYDKNTLDQIYATGRGGFKVRSRYNVDTKLNCIEITEIPPTTTVEAIIDKVVENVKLGKIKEISDIRDETDLSGLKLTIDYKRGVEPDKLMQKLFKTTSLEDSFSCNFNILIGGTPRVMGIVEILNEWTSFRSECIKRRVYFEMTKKQEKLHLLKGLAKILLDIDKAIKIIRQTDEEAEVVPNLMIGFGIDQIQSEYVAEIKLRHLNREYILKRTDEINQLEKDIDEMKSILADVTKLRNIVIKELKDASAKFGKPRKTDIIYESDAPEMEVEEDIPDYPVNIFITHDGYIKKITPQSLRMSGEQKLKEGDKIIRTDNCSNRCDLLAFTNRQQVYKLRLSDLDDTKASLMGEYLPAKLGMDEGEGVTYVALTSDYEGFMLFFFDNGKVAKVELSAYATKTNRKKLLGAYSDKCELSATLQIVQDCEILLTSSSTRMILMHSGAIAGKSTKNTIGVNVMTLKKGQKIVSAKEYTEGMLANPHRYRFKTLPSIGAMPAQEDLGEQLSL